MSKQKDSIHNYARGHFLIPIRLWIFRAVRRVLIISLLALTANLIFSYLFVTPKMWNLRQQNIALVANYQSLLEQISSTTAVIENIHQRENHQYRSLFSADTVLSPIVDQSQNDWTDLGYGRYSDIMVESQQSLDRLSWAVYRQSLSLDTLEQLATDKNLMLDHLPTLWPVDRSLIRANIGAFGMRVHPVTRRRAMHEGVDMSGAVGTPIYATANGMVKEANRRSGYGIQILLDHSFGYKTRYAHLSKLMVEAGQSVKRGDVIGLMGNTGRSTGPHLHYEVILQGKPVNPMAYLSRDMSAEEFRQIIENLRETTYESDEENE